MKGKRFLKDGARPPLRIVPVTEEHFAACAALIKMNEWSCVYLSERFIGFMEERRAGLAPRAAEFFMLAEGERCAECRGVLFVSRGGNVLHCLDCRVLKSRAWRRELRSFFKKRSVASIGGEAAANRFLERACGALFFSKTDYIFMRRLRDDGEGEARNPKGGLAVKGTDVYTCGEKNADMLLPLQVAYEEEEGGARGSALDESKVLLRLRGALRRETVIACRDVSTGRHLGKAGTNAKGFGWNQIGGVYTLPAERGRGIAAFMVDELARLSSNEGKSAVLFVKPKNKAARAAYAKSGFKECGAFRVAHSRGLALRLQINQ